MKIEANNTVKVHYTGKLDDGTVFDSSEGREPLQFTTGGGQMIPGFENAVMGMAVNETKTVTIPSAEAYGPKSDEMQHEVQKDQLPGDMAPEVGMSLISKSPDGQEMIVTIAEVRETTIVIDANHPLAGKDLTFDITVVEIA
jgi:FKBP-type peptidyl-prolyl cis-trans isomerase 2